MTVKRVVVVAAASRHGSTAEIATRLIATLSRELPDGWTVREGELANLRTFDTADAVVLGSSVYLGHWLRPALKALEYVTGNPPMGLWMFSSGPISDEIDDNGSIVTVEKLVESGEAVDHAVFAGRLDTSVLSWWERLPAKAVRATSGDWRDWQAIDQWAGTIAAQLTQANSVAPLWS
jgi:menaquinone-dependent protoporphyrinogen oxidase